MRLNAARRSTGLRADRRRFVGHDVARHAKSSVRADEPQEQSPQGLRAVDRQFLRVAPDPEHAAGMNRDARRRAADRVAHERGDAASIDHHLARRAVRRGEGRVFEPQSRPVADPDGGLGAGDAARADEPDDGMKTRKSRRARHPAPPASAPSIKV